MKTFEILMLSSLSLSILSFCVEVGRRNRWFHLLPSINLAFLLAHWLLEGVRWQMTPAYFLSVCIFLFTVRNIRFTFSPWLAWQSEGSKALRIFGVTLCLFILMDGGFLLWVAPLFKLPLPDGPYSVGTRNYYFVDESREEPFTPSTEDRRAISIEVWYPAQAVENFKPKPYMDSAKISAALGEFLSLPGIVFSHFSHIRTHSYLDAPVSETLPDYPVIIFSHAYGGNIVQNTVLMEELASHGYFVFSVGHAFETPYFIGAHEQVILFEAENPQRMARVAEMEDETSNHIKIELLTSTSAGEQAGLYRKLFDRNQNLIASVRIWAEDIQSLMDHLEQMSASDAFLAGRLDLTRIGVIGHSLGGAAAVQVCYLDARCKAGINMDGFQYGDFLDGALQQPFMFFYSSTLPGLNSQVNAYFYQRAENFAYSVVIGGAAHENFSDLPLYFRSQFPLIIRGQIDAVYCLQIVNSYTLAFFNQFLMGKPSPLLNETPPPYPEVEFTYHPPP